MAMTSKKILMCVFVATLVLVLSRCYTERAFSLQISGSPNTELIELKIDNQLLEKNLAVPNAKKTSEEIWKTYKISTHKKSHLLTATYKIDEKIHTKQCTLDITPSLLACNVEIWFSDEMQCTPCTDPIR